MNTNKRRTRESEKNDFEAGYSWQPRIFGAIWSVYFSFSTNAKNTLPAPPWALVRTFEKRKERLFDLGGRARLAGPCMCVCTYVWVRTLLSVEHTPRCQVEEGAEVRRWWVALVEVEESEGEPTHTHTHTHTHPLKDYNAKLARTGE